MHWNGVAEPKLFIFSPAPPMSLILAPAPAPASAKYCHLKLYYNSNTIRNMFQWRFFFILASSKLTAVHIYLKDNFGFGSGSRSQKISAPPAPAPKLCTEWLLLCGQIPDGGAGWRELFPRPKMADVRALPRVLHEDEGDQAGQCSEGRKHSTDCITIIIIILNRLFISNTEILSQKSTTYWSRAISISPVFTQGPLQ